MEVNDIELPKSPDFYYEIGSISGIVTSIGGVTLDGKATIHISKSSFEIGINEKQENELIQYYKKVKLRFVINKRIDVHTNIIKDAVLIEYEPIISQKLPNYGQKIREKFGDILYDNLDDEFFVQNK